MMCKTPGCKNGRYKRENNTYFDYCSLYCRDNQQEEGTVCVHAWLWVGGCGCVKEGECEVKSGLPSHYLHALIMQDEPCWNLLNVGCVHYQTALNSNTKTHPMEEFMNSVPDHMHHKLLSLVRMWFWNETLCSRLLEVL